MMKSFFKFAALAAMLLLSACTEKPAHEFTFGPEGKFKVLQFTDTHYIQGDSCSVRALECVREAIEAEKPDLIIHTGDIIFGKPDIPSAMEILKPISDSGIPFAVALGNHDSQFGATREEMFAAIRALPGCINTAPKKGVYGASNDVITLSGPNGVERVIYLFDSMDAVELKGEEGVHCYDFIRHSQIGWYEAWSQRFTAANGGVPVPSIAFFHIPLPEIKEALAAENCEIVGNLFEPPAPSRVNGGLFAQFRQLGDVEAAVYGHDHDNDYVVRQGPFWHIYGRYSGCDTVYNHLGIGGPSEQKVSGCRLFEFEQGQAGFRTWVRLYGGTVEQDIYLRLSQ